MQSLDLHDQDIILLRDVQTQKCLASDAVLEYSVGLEPAPLTSISSNSNSNTNTTQEQTLQNALSRFCFLAERIDMDKDGNPWFALRTAKGNYLQVIGDRLVLVQRTATPHPLDSDVATVLFRLSVVYPASERSYVLESLQGLTLKQRQSYSDSGTHMYMAEKEMIAGMPPEIIFEVSVLSKSREPGNIPIKDSSAVPTAASPMIQQPTKQQQQSQQPQGIVNKAKSMISRLWNATSAAATDSSSSTVTWSAGWIAVAVVLSVIALLALGMFMYWVFRFDIVNVTTVKNKDTTTADTNSANTNINTDAMPAVTSPPPVTISTPEITSTTTTPSRSADQLVVDTDQGVFE